MTWSASYNGEGARLKQIMSGAPTTYTLDLSVPLVQVLVAKDSSGDTRYLYGVTRIGEQQSGGWLYHLTDALGSVRQLADSSGNVQLARGYTPYGEPLWLNGAASSRYAFTGEDYDPTVGLVFLRARYTQPTLGVFLAKDPWSGNHLQPATYNGFNYGMGNPINLSDPSGLDASGIAGVLSCFNLHSLEMILPPPLPGLDPPWRAGDLITAQQAVDICRAAYQHKYWPAMFNLGQELPTSGHDLFGWFLNDWRGKFDSDWLFFDGEEPLTEELARTRVINNVRSWYYNGYNVTGPTLYKFNFLQNLMAGGDSFSSISKTSLPISFVLGSFWYQIRFLQTAHGDRVGFRIDNDMTLASGSHVAGRFEPEYDQFVETLIEEDPTLADKPLSELLRNTDKYRVISILRSRTREETAGQGGGNFYQTFAWTEPYSCDLLWRWFGVYSMKDEDIEVWDNYEKMTEDPTDYPSR